MLGVVGTDLSGVAMTLFSIVAACGVAAWIYSELFEYGCRHAEVLRTAMRELPVSQQHRQRCRMVLGQQYEMFSVLSAAKDRRTRTLHATCC